jgi:hypothetical protein
LKKLARRENRTKRKSLGATKINQESAVKPLTSDMGIYRASALYSGHRLEDHLLTQRLFDKENERKGIHGCAEKAISS